MREGAYVDNREHAAKRDIHDEKEQSAIEVHDSFLVVTKS